MPEYIGLTKIHIPVGWGMYSTAGNRSLNKKAQILMEDLRTGAGDIVLETKALSKYIRSYRRLNNTKTMAESSDTAVREQVWSFAQQAGSAIGWSQDAVDNIWERS